MHRQDISLDSSVHFSYLTEKKKSLIFSQAMEVLQYTGAEIHHPGARKLLQSNQCTVKDNRVYIPSQLVRWCLQRVPPITTVHHWDYSGKVRIEPYRSHFGPGPTCPNFIDPYSRKKRRYLRQDAANVARVCDALPEMDFVMSLGSISDVTDGLEEVYEFAEMIQASSKPIIAWCYSRQHCAFIHEIASAVAGGQEELQHRPLYFFYNEPVSPLTCDFNALDKLLYCARHGIPQIFAPANTSGATVPATHAAHLVVTLAESLIGVVLSQLKRPGSCIIIGGTQSILDMRRMVFSYGAPELSILSLCMTELADYIGLPVFVAGGCSDSKDTDLQSALEASFSLHSALLSGANLVHDAGFLESGMTGSLFQLVLADEVLSMGRRIIRGLSLEDLPQALQEIHRLGPGGSHLHTDLTQEMAVKNWQPRFMERRDYEAWREDGARRMRDRIQDYILQLLQNGTSRSSELSSQAREDIQQVLLRAETEKAKRD
ncbi:MAG: trimethylamine methyltransferase family protein [Desulfohalobiaceae bacterium]